jgi:CHAT domain-containing protein
MPLKSVLVSYVRFMHHRVIELKRDAGAVPGLELVPSYAAFVLHDPAEPPTIVPLGPAQPIDDKLERWIRLVRTKPAGIRTAAQKAEEELRLVGSTLRRSLWDPVAVYLRGAEMVFVVPDGPLHELSITTLPDKTGGYLIGSTSPIHYLSAERDLVRDTEPDRPGSRLLVMGGPDFDASTGPVSTAWREVAAHTMPQVAAGGEIFRGSTVNCDGFQAISFDLLPGSLDEVEEIAGIWGSDDFLLLTGGVAREDVFKEIAGRHKVLHLATHAFFVPGVCFSGLSENPLRLSGLVFAGANRRNEALPDHDDGILTAEEIASLDLSTVDWAVLSACDTGVGDVMNGEGVLGLRRAFEIAGAKTLIMSLWSVEDESTRAWMKELYRGRKEGLPTTEAVRRGSGQKGVPESARIVAEGRKNHPPFLLGSVRGDWGLEVAMSATRQLLITLSGPRSTRSRRSWGTRHHS